MTEKNASKRSLTREILGLLAGSVATSLAVHALLTAIALHLVDNFFAQNPAYTENQVITAQMWTVNACVAASLAFFIGLFLILLGRKLSYIADITRGVNALQQRAEHTVPLTGRNELTELAQAVNYLSVRERELRQKEQSLQAEREQLIRALSHDIRTPLTSILSYTEYLSAHPECDEAQRQSYLALMDGKARQIRQLTDILLDGSSRTPEYFDDARLLWQQLMEQMVSELEDVFPFTACVDCPPFVGTFDVAELQRIFDNLSSNIVKYADPAQPVTLTVTLHDGTLTLTQSNTVRSDAAGEGHRIGLLSIRRIAGQYGGTAEAITKDGKFTITVTLSEF